MSKQCGSCPSARQGVCPNSLEPNTLQKVESYPEAQRCPPGDQQCPYPSSYSSYPTTPQSGFSGAQQIFPNNPRGCSYVGPQASYSMSAERCIPRTPMNPCLGADECAHELFYALMSCEDNKKALDDFAKKSLQLYLQIPSVQPHVDYDPCVDFLKQQADLLLLDFEVHEVKNRNPFVVMTWKGKNPKLPPIMLNSHMDVEPVHWERWTHKPFSGERVRGKIYGRGAQNTKSVGIQYLEAIRRLKVRGKSFLRTIHVVFTPDRVMGGNYGMKEFVNTDEFRALKVGFVLDEGQASPTEEFLVFYAEKSVWQFVFHCRAGPGNDAGTTMLSPGEKAAVILNKLAEHKRIEKHRLKKNPDILPEITTMDVTQLSGGLAFNIEPEELTITVQCHVALEEDTERLEDTLKLWRDEAGKNVRLEFLKKEPIVNPTRLDYKNPYWASFSRAMSMMNLKIKPTVCPGATDSKYLRHKGYMVIGFSPINNHEMLAHSDDEYIKTETFLKGIEIYCNILTYLADIPE